MTWCCPTCGGELADSLTALRCVACALSFPVVDDVPDLRVGGADWVEEDRERARVLVRDSGDQTVAHLIRSVFAERGWDAVRVEARTRGTLEVPAVVGHELDGWLSRCASAPAGFLDVGCGPGGLLVAAAR